MIRFSNLARVATAALALSLGAGLTAASAETWSQKHPRRAEVNGRARESERPHQQGSEGRRDHQGSSSRAASAGSRRAPGRARHGLTERRPHHARRAARA